MVLWKVNESFTSFGELLTEHCEETFRTMRLVATNRLTERVSRMIRMLQDSSLEQRWLTGVSEQPRIFERICDEKLHCQALL